jgi:hypothetical protein
MSTARYGPVPKNPEVDLSRPDSKNSVSPSRALYFDATFLRFAHDLRGVPQVILQLIRFLESEKSLPPVRYLAAQASIDRFLAPLGVPLSRIEVVKPWPILGRWERFHGLGTSWQYRMLRSKALGIMHSEPRTLVSFAIPQWVLLYDLIIIERALSGEKSPLTRRWLYRRKLARLTHVTSSAAISAYTAERVRHFFPGLAEGCPTPLPLGVRPGLRLVTNRAEAGNSASLTKGDNSAGAASLAKWPLLPGAFICGFLRCPQECACHG